MRFFKRKKKKTDEPLNEAKKETTKAPEAETQSEDINKSQSETKKERKKNKKAEKKEAPKKEPDGIARSLLIVLGILLMHVVLVAGVGLIVLFFSGVIHYTEWILLGGSATILFCCYLVYRRMKAEGRQLRDILRSPTFHGKSLEISVLGGFASVKLNNSGPAAQNVLESGHPINQPMLESPEAIKVRELTELARLLEKNFITIEEYTTAKKEIFSKFSQKEEPVVQYFEHQNAPSNLKKV